jgi:hypothetical protein
MKSENRLQMQQLPSPPLIVDTTSYAPTAALHCDTTKVISSSDSPESSPAPQTPRSCDGKDEIVPIGFGFEFETHLEHAWHLKTARDRGRLERYSRYGMTRDDLRHPTPEYMREAYREFIDLAMEELHAPSPSPPPEFRQPPSVPKRLAISSLFHDAKISSNKSGPRRENARLATKQGPRPTSKQRTTLVQQNNKKDRGNRVAKSVHSMETRSRLKQRLEAAGRIMSDRFAG